MDRNPALQAVIDFVHELYVSGVSRVVVSPGSRSTPLTIACARQPGLTVYNVLDERSAAFLALGMARALHQPVALICTSGTAAANYLPAVVEAHFSRVPLLLLTADRPPELRGIGANQTIWQTRLYGPYVKWFYELPVPEESAFMMRHARAQANRAVAIAAQAPQGPVHINWPLREPLLPPVVETAAVQGRDVSLPATSIYSESRQAPASAELWASRLHQYKRGLIVCGPRDDPETAAAARALARRTGWVLLADPLSQARTNCRDDDFVLWEYDTLLRAWTIEDRLVAQPDVIIRTGATPTSKVLGECLSLWREARHIVIDEALMENDPFISTTDAIQASPAEWLNALMESPGLTLTTSDSAFTKLWQAGRDCVRAATAAHLSALGRLNEGRIITELADMLPDGACLFVGNSMPVRDLDSFFPCTDKNIRVLANRGASGIDGVVSSALGTAAALPVPCTLVIGDLSFLHDLGGLLAAKQQRIALTIVVVQNDGGGIFSFLPQAQEEDVFAHFSTPHGLSLEGAAALFGGHYTRAENWETLR
ncbi:MAG: 2-succinyl-5-enolpyruvyl-6-hydroxy-3-cyclohexene-1-carboxylic-acid synthase, partial [Firmicutes bacterium]|nr:2-succinyl-5-enolpyruvyl-6-hydroxy-3-cyclohexene-1-carboxylic-acid synthase [Bacillota bacterium]